MRGLQLVVLVALATVFASCAREVDAKSPLHAQLLEIMRERQRLWDAPPPERTREIDISETVCSLVSHDEFKALQPLADMEHQPHYGDVLGGPADTELWVLKGDHLSWGRGILAIFLGSGDYCFVTYRPME